MDWAIWIVLSLTGGVILFVGVAIGTRLSSKDWYEDAVDGLEQLLEATAHLKAANKYKTNFVPAAAMWGAKEDAYQEVANLLALIAGHPQPYPEANWKWRE